MVKLLFAMGGGWGISRDSGCPCVVGQSLAVLNEVCEVFQLLASKARGERKQAGAGASHHHFGVGGRHCRGQVYRVL